MATFNGDAGDNTLTGGSGDDVLYGRGGDDTLDGGAGDDLIHGGGNDDWYDFVVFTGAVSGVTVDLQSGYALDGQGGYDSLTGIEAATGTAFDDTFIGDAGENWFEPGGGNNSLTGGGGPDRVAYGNLATYGITGGIDATQSRVSKSDGSVDTLSGFSMFFGTGSADTFTMSGARAYTIFAGDGDDRLTGGSGGDHLIGGQGADSFDGGAGEDAASYWDAAAGVAAYLYDPSANTGDAAGDSYSRIENLIGSEHADDLRGNGAANDLWGRAGDDTLHGLAGDDTLNGSAGDDTLIGGLGSDWMAGGSGADTLFGGDGGNDIVSYIEDALAGGTAGVFVDLGNETATDGFGHTDRIVGFEKVEGTQQNDRFVGRDSGWESFTGFAGDDTIDAGGGGGRLSYVEERSQPGSSAGIHINFALGQATDTFGDTDTVIGIDHVRGTLLADTAVGDDSDWNQFNMLAGADVIDGAGGFDRVNYWQDHIYGGTAGIVVNLAAGTVVDGFGDTDRLTNIEDIWGTRSADRMYGSAGDDRFSGFHGNDIIDGGTGGYDVVRYDQNHMVLDYADVSAPIGGVMVDLGAGTAQDGFGTTDTLANIERVFASRLADSITGGGSEIWESFVGMAGDDTIDGGGGFDRVNYAMEVHRGGGAGVTVDLETGVAIDSFGDTDTLIDIQSVRATAQADVLRGGNAEDPQASADHDGLERFHGLAGDDLIDGRGGLRDEVDYRWDAAYGGTAAVTVDLGLGTATDGFGDTDSLYNIEYVRATNADDRLYGSAANNRLDGQGGGDLMVGRAGNDRYIVDDAGDRVIEYAGQGWDWVDSAVSFSLRQHSQHLEVLTLTGDGDIDGTGNGQANRIFANAGDNTLNGAGGNDLLFGGAGNDLFRDDAGADRMAGGLGNDRYIVDHAGDRVIEYAGQGWDRVDSEISFSLRQHSQHLEVLTLTGDGDIDGTGNGQANRIFANAGNNTLNGAGGNDLLFGGAGNDLLRDDAGGDRMAGGLGNDRYIVDNTGDRLIEYAGQGWDRVDSSISFVLRDHSHHLEVLNLTGTADIDGTGNGQANRIFGNAGDNSLNGAGGNDLLFGGDGNDLLQSSEGSDRMAGGTGNDRFQIDSAGDAVVEHRGQGWDRVESAIDFSLRQHSHHIEVLNLTGLANTNGTGNGQGNRIFGTTGDNTLDGAAGDDVIVGGAGSDRLIGGLGDDRLYGNTLSAAYDNDGADVFVFTDGHGHDVVASAGSGDILDFGGLSTLNSWQDVQNAMTGDAHHVLIQTGDNSSLRVETVGISSFDGDEFVF